MPLTWPMTNWSRLDEMRFLLDMPISPYLADWLTQQGHDAVHAIQTGMAKSPDSELLAYAAIENRALVTADLDFSRLLAAAATNRPSIILFRGGNHTEAQMKALLDDMLRNVPELAEQGLFVVVDGKRIRKRFLPLLRSSSG